MFSQHYEVVYKQIGTNKLQLEHVGQTWREAAEQTTKPLLRLYS